MKEEIERDFSMTEGHMMEQAQRFLSQFLENPTDFTDKYNVFKTPFDTKMQDAIDLCMAATTDQESTSRQHIETEKIEVLMGTSRFTYQDGVEYTKIAFKGDKAMMIAFGQPSYEKARNSHILMPPLLMQAYNLAMDVEYKTKYIAEGFTLLKIEALKTLAEAINTRVQKQVKLKGARTLSTQDRTINLNALWAMMVLLSDCSKKIYVDNPAMWNLYLLYPDNPPTPPTPDPEPPIE